MTADDRGLEALACDLEVDEIDGALWQTKERKQVGKSRAAEVIEARQRSVEGEAAYTKTALGDQLRFVRGQDGKVGRGLAEDQVAHAFVAAAVREFVLPLSKVDHDFSVPEHENKKRVRMVWILNILKPPS